MRLWSVVTITRHQATCRSSAVVAAWPAVQVAQWPSVITQSRPEIVVLRSVTIQWPPARTASPLGGKMLQLGTTPSRSVGTTFRMPPSRWLWEHNPRRDLFMGRWLSRVVRLQREATRSAEFIYSRR